VVPQFYKHFVPPGLKTTTENQNFLYRDDFEFLFVLFPKPLESVSQLRPVLSCVREFGDELRERLGVSRDP